MSLLVALLLSGTSVELDPAWQPVADPKALFAAGNIQCHEPDLQNRTCRAMSWYSPEPGGGMRFRMVSALSNQHGLAIAYSGTMRWQGSSICFVLDDAVLDRSHLVGMAAPHARVTDKRFSLYFREKVLQAYGNRNICDHVYQHRDTGDYLNIGTVDGEFAGEMMRGFSIIDAKSGYRLRAAND